MIENEGMPQHKRPFDKGNLYIHFVVEFPKPGSLTPKQVKLLEEVLPPRRPSPKVTPEVEEVELKKIPDTQQQRSKGQGGRSREAYDDDEEGPGSGGQRVQCAQQ